jgi:predicted MFS family arabinose efflux permease
MTQQQRQILYKGISKILFMMGECMFLGIAIGSVLAENTIVSRIFLSGIGLVVSAAFLCAIYTLLLNIKLKNNGSICFSIGCAGNNSRNCGFQFSPHRSSSI